MKKGWLIILLGSVILIVALAASLAPGGVRAGDTVTIHYTLTLDDGTVYDSSLGREPLTTTLGQGQFIASFEDELLGMRPGEVKNFTLSPEEAFGEYRTDLIGTVERSWLPESVKPQIGKEVQTEFQDGTPVIAVIKEFDNTSITLDANHPLAGRTLTFKVQLLAIRSTAPNPTSSTWLWLRFAGTLLVGAFAFLYIRKRQSSATAPKSVGGLKKKQHQHA